MSPVLTGRMPEPLLLAGLAADRADAWLTRYNEAAASVHVADVATGTVVARAIVSRNGGRRTRLTRARGW